MNMGLLDGKLYFPKDLEEAWEIKQLSSKDSVFMAGGTLLHTQWERGLPCPGHLISLNHIDELTEITEIKEKKQLSLQIGARSLLSNCQKHPDIKNRWNLLSKAIGQIAAPAIRNIGTIGGNVAFGKGDSIPALMVLDAEVIFFSLNGRNKLAIDTWLLEKKDREEEILVGIVLPELKETEGVFSFYQKVGRRESFTGSVVTVAGIVSQNAVGAINYVRLAAGGGDSYPVRLYHTEKLLLNKTVNEERIVDVYKTIIKEFKPVSDAFFTDDYRQRVAANLITAKLAEMEGKE
jgi:xanthine dehydrogenase small subunit